MRRRFLPKVKHSGVTIHLLQWKKSLISVSFLKRIKELDEEGRRIKIYDEFIPVTARKMSALKKACVEYKLNRGENS